MTTQPSPPPREGAYRINPATERIEIYRDGRWLDWVQSAKEMAS